MMNNTEARIREFAHQIWEQEGRPVGQEYRHWEMACNLAGAHNDDDAEELGSGHVISIIAPDEPFDPNPKPEIDPAPAQPGQSNPTPKPEIEPQPPQPEQPASPNVPVDPISPVETPPHISPTPPATPIQPADPVQPGNPSQPIQPYDSKYTAETTRMALQEDGVVSAATKTSRARKTKSTTQQGSIGL